MLITCKRDFVFYKALLIVYNTFRAQHEDGCIRGAETCCCWQWFNCNYLIRIVLDWAIIYFILSAVQFTCASLHCQPPPSIRNCHYWMNVITCRMCKIRNKARDKFVCCHTAIVQRSGEMMAGYGGEKGLRLIVIMLSVLRQIVTDFNERILVTEQ